MNLSDIDHIMEQWAPREIAWERDNVGIQIGSKRQAIRRILVTLDVNNDVVKEAIRRRADLIFSHHPLLFHPLKRVSSDDRIGQLVTLLTKHNIAVYSAHTNLDFTKGGVSVVLAEQIGLSNITVLQKNQQVYKKVIVFVPSKYYERVMTAMAEAGAGAIGNYDSCSFGSEGSGTFRAKSGAKPFAGNVGHLEHVKEIRLEMIVPSWNLNDVLAAMRKAHPYEEIAHDIYDLANVSTEYGAGAIGEYQKPISTRNFLAKVKKSLNASAVRYGGNLSHPIRRVAVCGGSGSNMLQHAIDNDADAFITADISYHYFEQADDRILIVDAGHFETEHPILQRVVKRLTTECTKHRAGAHVMASTTARNPVHYYL